MNHRHPVVLLVRRPDDDRLVLGVVLYSFQKIPHLVGKLQHVIHYDDGPCFELRFDHLEVGQVLLLRSVEEYNIKRAIKRGDHLDRLTLDHRDDLLQLHLADVRSGRLDHLAIDLDAR